MKSILVQTGATYPTLSWGLSGPSGSLGEHIKVVSNSNQTGQVDICFYGTPSGLFYPNNGAYPKTLTWNATPRALSYQISYFLLNHYGNRTYFNATSTTSSYTFPFVIGCCSGYGLVSKVRAVYSGGVISDWSPEFNMTFGY